MQGGMVRRLIYVSYQAFYHKKDFIESKGNRRINANWLEPVSVFHYEGTPKEKKKVLCSFSIIVYRSIRT
jgi:hypothetical protein